MSSSAGFPTPSRTSRNNRRARRGSGVSLNPRSLPVTLKYGLPVALVAGLVFTVVSWGIESWNRTHAKLAVVDQRGDPISQGTVDFFPYDTSRSSPSPLPIMATVELSGLDVMTLGWEEVPGEAVVRVRAPGYGIGFGFVESGGDLDEISLGPPVSMEGRILDARGRPVSDAVIVGLGGGQRGVPLAETVSGADGTFRLEGLSATLANVTLRVLGQGHAVFHDTLWRNNREESELRLQPTEPVQGKLQGFGELDLSALQILAYNLPGVGAELGSDGTFQLDFLPPKVRVLLLVHGLPAGYTHRGAPVIAGGEDAVIEISRASTLRGRALLADSEDPAPGAIIYHENGPSGRQTVTADAGGWFSLDAVPAGEVWLHASGSFAEITEVDGVRETRGVNRSGRRSIEVEGGQDLDGVEIRVY